jgi:hypothetical protein
MLISPYANCWLLSLHVVHSEKLIPVLFWQVNNKATVDILPSDTILNSTNAPDNSNAVVEPEPAAADPAQSAPLNHMPPPPGFPGFSHPQLYNLYYTQMGYYPPPPPPPEYHHPHPYNMLAAPLRYHPYTHDTRDRQQLCYSSPPAQWPLSDPVEMTKNDNSKGPLLVDWLLKLDTDAICGSANFSQYLEKFTNQEFTNIRDIVDQELL